MKLLGKPQPRLEFSVLVEQELPTLYRVARRMVKNDEDAEDLVGQALLKAVRAYNQFDGRYPRSWLIQILRNEHLDLLRRRRIRPEVSLPDQVDQATDRFWEAIDWKIVGTEILAVFDQLPPDHRIAVALCDVEDLSYREAAAALGVSVATVRSRLFRGRKLLRTLLVNFEPNLKPNPTL